MPGHIETDAYAFDPEAARQALAASSYGGPEKLPEVCYYADDPEGPDEAEWLAGKYREVLGVEITLLPTTDENGGAFDGRGDHAAVRLVELGPGLLRPPELAEPRLDLRDGVLRPAAGYCNPQFDALVKQADQETDQDGACGSTRRRNDCSSRTRPSRLAFRTPMR